MTRTAVFCPRRAMYWSRRSGGDAAQGIHQMGQGGLVGGLVGDQRGPA